MTRKEAQKHFEDRYKQEKEKKLAEFHEKLQKELQEVMKRILLAFEEIAKQAQENKKQGCIHFNFSLLRYDLLNNQARVRLDVSDAEWVLDKEPLYAEFDLTFLFSGYFEWKEKLLTDMREYMGKVNKYDVEYMVQNEIMTCVSLLNHYLRFIFRDIDKQESFMKIPKFDFWNIRFGEYRDYSEIIVQADKVPKSMEQWLDKLENYNENPQIFMCSFWYKTNLCKCSSSKKDMHFITFEECIIEDFDFSDSGMTGARFINCQLKRCSFENAVLIQAEFSQCIFEECSFKNAVLNNAVFSAQGIEEQWFDDTQKKEMFIRV